jgi:hypothetical protein
VRFGVPGGEDAQPLKDQYVGPAVTKLTGFFTKNLAAGRAPAGAASA